MNPKQGLMRLLVEGAQETLSELPATSDEGRRAVLIDAVGRLGASEAVSVLSAHYRDSERVGVFRAIPDATRSAQLSYGVGIRPTWVLTPV